MFPMSKAIVSYLGFDRYLVLVRDKSHQTRHERLNFGSGYLWRGCVSKFLFTFLPFSVCILHRSKTPNLHLTLKKSCRNPLS